MIKGFVLANTSDDSWHEVIDHILVITRGECTGALEQLMLVANELIHRRRFPKWYIVVIDSVSFLPLPFPVPCNSFNSFYLQFFKPAGMFVGVCTFYIAFLD